MVRYPHTLRITTVTDATRDGGGNWIPGGPTNMDIECRAVVNGGNETLVGSDGIRTDFAWLVYMPKQDPSFDIKKGTEVKILDGEKVLATEKVKRYFNGQLNARPGYELQCKP
jgi:hypothetical protein